MDGMELGDMGSGCEDENCGLTSGFAEDCVSQECPVFGLIELVSVTIIYIPLMLFGLLGNILTILVVWLRPQMRSSTYLYLSSMAVSDLLILLLMPLDLYKIWRPSPWPLGDLACKLSMFLSECCTFCTILHITFLSLERYLAVCWPITAKTLVTRRRTRVLIGCLWLGAAISAAPVLIMVGVEEVGGMEKGINGWREDRGWTGGEGEQGRFFIGGGKVGSAYVDSMDGGLEVTKWDENETKGWSERVGDLGKKGERIGILDETKQENGGQRRDEKQAEYGGEEDKKMQVDGKKQNKMKEDEGGGSEEDFFGNHEGEIDRRECRYSDYAATSGLLSAMTILSNMYFLIPFCILGLVYSLIGRTLWLRPQSSRKDQSHRHTVKMLGVIVLAFVLCWLPFHVGRTIFSLSFSVSAETQETPMDTNSHLDINMLTDGTERYNNIYTVTKPISHTSSDMHIETLSKTEKLTAHTVIDDCDTCANTKVKINTKINLDTHLADTETETHPNMDTNSDDKSKYKCLYSHIISHTRGQHISTGTKTINLNPSIETDTHTLTHTEIQNDPTHVRTQMGKFTDNKDNLKQNNTNTSLNSKKNRESICINSQNDTPTTTHRPYTAGTFATPSDLYSDNTHNDTRFNSSYTHPDKNALFYYYLTQYLNLASSVLFYLSAAVNPLLYNLMSARYRHAVHSLIRKHSETQAHRLRTTLTARHSTTTL